MIIHIALYKWKTSASAKPLSDALNGIESLADKIPGIIEINCAKNTSKYSEGYTHVILVRGEDQAALDAYRAHPEHAKWAAVIESMEDHGIGVDFSTNEDGLAPPLEVAQLYFELSNNSDFEGIGKLLTESTTYSSQTTGIYLGKEAIIAMQKDFHDMFKSLNWKVNAVKEVKPGIILFDYDFTAKTLKGEGVHLSGVEYVIVQSGKIQHIEIKSK